MFFIIHLGDITVSHLKIDWRKYITKLFPSFKDAFNPDFFMTSKGFMEENQRFGVVKIY